MNRENNFSFIHMMGALMVVFGHQYALMGCALPTVLKIDVNGLGVRIIFVMSGFLMTESYFRSKNAREYLYKRIVRIYPQLATFTIVSAIVGIIFTTCTVEEYSVGVMDYVIKNLLFNPKMDLPGVFVNNIYPVAVNGSLWTLPIEVLCYILLVFFMKMCEVLERKSVFVAQSCYAAICLGIAGAYILHSMGIIAGSFVFWGTDWANAIRVSAYFFMGSLFSKLDLKRYCNLQIAVVLWIVFEAVEGRVANIMLIFVITYITLSFAFANKPIFSSVIKNNICYGIYIWSFPIQQALIEILIVRNNMQCSPLCMFFISIVPILLMSYLTYFTIEKWVTKRVVVRKQKKLVS